MKRGVAGIIGAYLEQEVTLDPALPPVLVRGKVDRLLRLPHYSRPTYAPIEIKQHAQPSAADEVQLDFYVWLLGLSQGVIPPAEFWLSRDEYSRPASRLEHEYDESRLLALLDRAVHLLSLQEAPPVRLESHCKVCPWYSACSALAQQEGHLGLLYNVSHKTRDGLRHAGITTLVQVAACSLEKLRQVKGIGPVTAPAIRANAEAWVNKRPVHFAPLPAICQQSGWMFDLETLDTGIPWSLGWCDPAGNTQVALAAPVQAPKVQTLSDGLTVTLAPGSDGIWQVFAESVRGSSGPVYHWTGFDLSILRATAPADVRAEIEPRMLDLHRAITRSISFPLSSTSIKTISTYLGYPWPGYNEWFAAFLDYREWLNSDNLDALTRACTYQRADVQSMAWVWNWLLSEWV